MKRNTILVTLLFTFFFFLSFQHSAFAAENNLIHFQETVIHDYQKVEGILVIGNNATIDGTVRAAVIVINGDLSIHRTATIEGPILVIGGRVELDKGAKIGEHLLAFELNDATQNSFLFGGALFLGIWFIRIIGSIFVAIITILTGILMKQRLVAVRESIANQYGRMVVTGAIASLALIALSILLTISVIGIPIVIILFVGVLLSFFIGMSILSEIISKQVKGMEETSLWRKVALGCFILIACMSVPLVGGFIILLTTWFSLGVSIKWIVNKWSSRKK